MRGATQAAGDWPAERERALAVLRADAEAHPQTRYRGPVLVDVLLDDKDLDAA
ncbi:hypothetical protein [Streptomyces cinnamoneus]|uniref:hypothetical protein n=1 Tax=Streptomyces cinnamoneus TaxID=53446 RepID=UPI0037ADDF7D